MLPGRVAPFKGKKVRLEGSKALKRDFHSVHVAIALHFILEDRRFEDGAVHQHPNAFLDSFDDRGVGMSEFGQGFDAFVHFDQEGDGLDG